MRSLSALTAALCVACASTPRPVPQVPLAASWSIEAESAQPRTATDPQLGAASWASFRSSELGELLALALANNLDSAAAEARAAQEEALIRVARAPLYPMLGAMLALTVQSENGRSLGSLSGGFFDAGLVASYEADIWGKNSERLAVAKARSRAAGYDRASTLLLVAAGVADTYFEVLALRERMTRARTNLELTQRVLGLVEAKERAGSALAREVASQRVLVASEAVRLEQLAQAEADARVTLAVVLGREPNAIAVRAESLDPITDPGVSLAGVEVPTRLLARRPDVARAEVGLAAQDADVEAARAALLPTLRLDASVALQSVFLSKYYDGNSIVYSGIVSLNQPVFDGGELRGRRDAALARRREAEADYRRAVITAVSDVERALRAIHSLERQHAQQRVAVDESRRAFTLLESELQAGAEELVTVLDAQRTLFRVEDEWSQMRLAKLRASVALVKALGGGWSPDSAL